MAQFFELVGEVLMGQQLTTRLSFLLSPFPRSNHSECNLFLFVPVVPSHFPPSV